LLKIPKKPQEMLRYWLSRDLVENRANMAADMSLQGRGEAAIRLSPSRLA